MALVNCKECGKEISDQANRCSHCGAGRFTSVGVNSLIGVRIIGILLGIGGLYFVSRYEEGIGTIGYILIGLAFILLVNKWKQKGQDFSTPRGMKGKGTDIEEIIVAECPQCGHGLTKRKEYCPQCGAKL